MSQEAVRLRPDRVALLLDETHAPAVAEALRNRGHDVVAVAERTDHRAMADAELFSRAGQEAGRLVAENVKDCRRLFLHAEESARRKIALLYTSSRTLPRSRGSPGPLVAALCQSAVARRPAEDWLRPA